MYKAAITVYTLTAAYFRDTRVNNDGPVDMVWAEEASPDYFYIWYLDQPNQQPLRDCLAASCAYNSDTHIWTVQLATGQVLKLFDMGSEWEIAKRRRDKKRR